MTRGTPLICGVWSPAADQAPLEQSRHLLLHRPLPGLKAGNPENHFRTGNENPGSTSWLDPLLRRRIMQPPPLLLRFARGGNVFVILAVVLLTIWGLAELH